MPIAVVIPPCGAQGTCPLTKELLMSRSETLAELFDGRGPDCDDPRLPDFLQRILERQAETSPTVELLPKGPVQPRETPIRKA